MGSARTYVALAAVLGALVAAIGCSSVSTTVPIGEPATAEETQQFVGVWMVPNEGPLYARYGGENRLRVASVSWDEKNSEYQLTEADCLITKDEDLVYANLQDPKSEQAKSPVAPTFGFGRLILTDADELQVIRPKVETFEKAVGDGKLVGQIEQAGMFTTIKLKPTANQLSDLVTPSKAAEQFVLEEPLVLRRIQRFEDEQK